MWSWMYLRKETEPPGGVGQREVPPEKPLLCEQVVSNDPLLCWIRLVSLDKSGIGMCELADGCLPPPPHPPADSGSANPDKTVVNQFVMVQNLGRNWGTVHKGGGGLDCLLRIQSNKQSSVCSILVSYKWDSTLPIRIFKQFWKEKFWLRLFFNPKPHSRGRICPHCFQRPITQKDLKWTVAPDFRPLVFLVNRPHMGFRFTS
jgi:hypothetical protein